MTQLLELAPLANQSFTATLGGRRYELALRALGGGVGVDVTRDDVVLIQGVRAVPGAFLIPYGYLEDGNFLITTEGDALVDFEQFGLTQSLYYFSAEEMLARG